MRYLGGKSRLAKEIAAVVAPKGLWWEPFCGGLSVSVQLAKYGPGIVSDVNPALIALYQSVRDGWEPPTSVSEDEYRAARALPDSDPLKAFVGFGCSFGGKWFGGYARPDPRRKNPEESYALSSRRSILRDLAALRGSVITRLNFGDVEPGTLSVESIYCDPPYAGTTGYKGVAAFDHEAFWSRCQEWAALGVRVYVSEYACPVKSDVRWQRTHSMNVSGGTGEARVERLFRVLPVAQAAEAA